MTAHLGDRLAALVDGQLDHSDRDRVLAHLARCEPCRREAAEQRALKARLDHLDVRAPGGLESRLLSLRTAAPSPPPAPWAPYPAPAATSARATGLGGRARSSAATGLLLLGAGFGGWLVVLDDPAQAPPRDPSSVDLVVQHVSTTTQLPLTDPASVGTAWSAVTAGTTGGGIVTSGR